MVETVLRMEKIVKDFPGVRALNEVSITLNKGEVLALVGENGAGKSTLMKILSGVIPPDQGRIYLNEKLVQIKSPHYAQEMGISIIHQEFNLIPLLNVAENIFFGKEPKRKKCKWFIDWKQLYRDTNNLLEKLGMDIDVRKPVNQLSVAHQQMVEIAKAFSIQADVIIMDEPTATLTQHEIDNLFRIIHSLKERGVAIIYISHRLEELFQIADRVTVMRDGTVVSTVNRKDVDKQQLITMMVGRELQNEFPKRKTAPQEITLSISGLTNHKLKNVSMEFRRGEVVGLAGLVGAGRTELARAVCGIDPITSGTIKVFDQKMRFTCPSQAIQAGIGLIPEDRKGQGLILEMTVQENTTFALLKKVVHWGLLDWQKERTIVERFIDVLRIKTPSPRQKTINLSGGNQQKVVLAKWLFVGSKILFLDEPTRGVDVGAKREIYQLINDLAEQGITVILISSELPEILGMSDRIYVMHEGRVTKMLSAAEATEQNILTYATGVINP